MSNKHPYLSPDRPRVFAHRGLAFEAGIDENTLLAFSTAIEAGIEYIESDIQVTSDGVAVLFHDSDLARVAGVAKRVDQLTLQELSRVTLTFGGSVPTLEQTLVQFSETKFNLDVKVQGAIAPAVEVINRLGAHNRVLVSAFSERRRRVALRGLSLPVASSAGSALVVALHFASSLRLTSLMRLISKSADALQVPLRSGPFRFDSPAFISRAHKAGLEVHFWTINEPEEMKRLISMGADGIVTDRADLAIEVLKK